MMTGSGARGWISRLFERWRWVVVLCCAVLFSGRIVSSGAEEGSGLAVFLITELVTRGLFHMVEAALRSIYP